MKLLHPLPLSAMRVKNFLSSPGVDADVAGDPYDQGLKNGEWVFEFKLLDGDPAAVLRGWSHSDLGGDGVGMWEEGCSRSLYSLLFLIGRSKPWLRWVQRSQRSMVVLHWSRGLGLPAL